MVSYWSYTISGSTEPVSIILFCMKGSESTSAVGLVHSYILLKKIYKNNFFEVVTVKPR